MKNPIIILIGLIGLIIALVLGYVVFVKPKVDEQVQAPEASNNMADTAPDDTSTPIPVPDDNSEIDTADWRVYRNDTYGFEIKYPTTLYLFDCSSNFYEQNPLYVHLTPNKNSDCNSPYKAIDSLIAISHVKNFNKNDLMNLLDRNQKEENIIIDNKSSIQISGENEVLGDEGEKLSSEPIRELVFTVVPTENAVYTIIEYSRIASTKNNANGFTVGEDLRGVYNQILSTFKFTDENEIDKIYKLDCTDKPDSFQSKYSWYNYFKEQVMGNWSLDVICYNNELNKAVYLKSKIDWGNYVYDPKRTSYGLSQFGIYNIKKDQFDRGQEKDLGFYEGCGIIKKWNKNNEIVYQCGSGDAGVGITRTCSYNTINKTTRLIEECDSQDGREPKEICTEK